MTDLAALTAPIVVTLHLEPREDGGLRVSSPNVPGLMLSSADIKGLMHDLGPAIQVLLWHNGIAVVDAPDLDKLEALANAARTGNGIASSKFIAAARTVVPDMIAELRALRAENERLRAAKDGAYRERDQLVCALSKVFPSRLERHPDSDTAWENDWRWIVYIDIPTRYPVVFGDMRDMLPESRSFLTSIKQVSWHIHDSELPMFAHLRRDIRIGWDGHSTEEKYERLSKLHVARSALKGE